MTQATHEIRSLLLRAMGLAPVACAASLAACGVEAEQSVVAGDFAEQLELAPLSDGQSGPPNTLSLDLPAPLDAGVYLDAFVSGATPGATVYLTFSQTTGPGPCPGVMNGTCLDVSAPTVLGTGTAGNNGIASISFSLPHDLPEGSAAYFQAASPTAGPGDTSPVGLDFVTYPPRTCGDYPWLNASTLLFGSYLVCAPIPASGSCPTYSSVRPGQVERLFERATGTTMTAPFGGYDMFLTCDELSVENACCFGAEVYQFAVGRPFLVEGQARVAADGCGEDWASPVAVDTRGLSRRARRRLAARWTRTAKAEHASVAAFARFNLQLLQLGAPASLVADAARAMSDEIRHAADAFGIASAFAGQPVGVGTFDMTGALDETDIRTIVLETFREGCIAETIAATQAAVARDATTEPAIVEVLERVAEDEARHAALAWRFVKWAVAAHPELREDLAAIVAEGPSTELVALDPLADTLRAYGAPCDAELQQVAREVFTDVIEPAAAALLGRPVGVGLAA